MHTLWIGTALGAFGTTLIAAARAVLLSLATLLGPGGILGL